MCSFMLCCFGRRERLALVDVYNPAVCKGRGTAAILKEE